MKIIKKGREKDLKKTKRFTCRECGCVFEADKGEYQSGQQYNETYFFCKCPFCGKEAPETVMRGAE